MARQWPGDLGLICYIGLPTAELFSPDRPADVTAVAQATGRND
jgi:hypothetical protein